MIGPTGADNRRAMKRRTFTTELAGVLLAAPWSILGGASPPRAHRRPVVVPPLYLRIALEYIRREFVTETVSLMLWRSTIVLLLALALQADGVAQSFPSKPIVIVVPYAAGGAPDLVARILAEKLTASLGQPVRVENRPGASGNIAAANVAQSAPDGHTLLIGDNALLTISPFVYHNDSFNALRDLVPAAALVESSVLLLVSADLPVTTLQEFVDYARRARPPSTTRRISGS